MPQDCVGYAHLLHAVAPEEASEAGIPSTEAEMTALDTTDLATLVSNALGAIGMGDMFLPGALTSTNTRLHLATLGMLFLYKPGMESSVGDDAGDASEAAAADDGADVDADEEEDTFDAGAGAGAGAGGVVPAPSAVRHGVVVVVGWWLLGVCVVVASPIGGVVMFVQWRVCRHRRRPARSTR